MSQAVNSNELGIVYRKVAELIPYDRNSRTHSDEQVATVAKSIQEFGFTQPVLIGNDDVIIAGHGRVMAAKSIGMDQVPTICLGHLSDEQRRAYVIADNKLAEQAGWDDELLALELGALSDLGYGLEVTGFNDKELADILAAESTPGLTDDDDAPALEANHSSRQGDIWVLGDHRVMCGDSTSAEDIGALLGGGMADMWLTDPPYNVAYEGKTKEALTIQNDEMDDQSFREFLVAAYKAADSGMKSGAVFYIWHADSEGYNFRGAAKDVNWQVRQCLIWKKQTIVMGRQDYHWKHEPCLYGWKSGSGHLWASDRKQSTILEFDRPSKNTEHPTMKPVELFEYQMLNNTKGGDIVLDSFGGSGTTVIAAEKNGRHARVMELDPNYVDVIIKRWQNYTGQQAFLEATGQSFDQVALERAA